MTPAYSTQLESATAAGSHSTPATDPYTLSPPRLVSRRQPTLLITRPQVSSFRFTPRAGLTQSLSRTSSPQLSSPILTPPPSRASRGLLLARHPGPLFRPDRHSLPPSPTSSSSESWFFDSDDEYSDFELGIEQASLIRLVQNLDPSVMHNADNSMSAPGDGGLPVPASFAGVSPMPVVPSQPDIRQYDPGVSASTACPFQQQQQQQTSPAYFAVDHIAIPSSSHSSAHDAARYIPSFNSFAIASVPTGHKLLSPAVHPSSPPYTPMGTGDQYAMYTPLTAAQNAAPAIAIPASDSAASLPMDPQAFAALAFPPLIANTPTSFLVPESGRFQEQAASTLLSPVSTPASYMPSPAAMSAAYPDHSSPPSNEASPPPTRSASRTSMHFIPILPLSLSPTESCSRDLSPLLPRRRHSTASSSASTCTKPSAAAADDDPIKQARAAAKRARNTDAARRSRLRRNKRLDELEMLARELEARNRELRLRAAVAQADREACQAREREMKARVAFLEDKMLQVYQGKAVAGQEK